MNITDDRILVTGAGGQLGRLVVDHLLRALPADCIVAMVRRPEAGAAFAARGVEVRVADYDRPETLTAALAGIPRVLLISSSVLGRRAEQHGNVITAARGAGVRLIAYTSLLHADSSPLGLAHEHRQSEALLSASGIAYVILRNGWYTENYTRSLAEVLAHGAVIGCAGPGRISSASRDDYAAAAAILVSQAEPPAGTTLELAGDTAYTLADYAAEIGRRTGRTIPYRDLSEEEHRSALEAAGLPAAVAALLADCDAGAAKGALFDASGTLARLIGRPTTPMGVTVATALG